MMEINNFNERAYGLRILKKFFNDKSESHIKHLFDVIYSYGIMKEDKLEELEKNIYNVEKVLLDSLREFELNQINKL
jgi:hypothetical protein